MNETEARVIPLRAGVRAVAQPPHDEQGRLDYWRSVQALRAELQALEVG